MVCRSKAADSSFWSLVMGSILLIGIGMPVIQTLRRGDAAELRRLVRKAGLRQQLAATSAEVLPPIGSKRASAPSERTLPRT
jgi:hypothetical protein